MSVRDSLPIYQHKEELLALVRENDVSVIVGETGSGKSTLLPVFLLEDGFAQDGGGMIAITQPRRIAAISLAEYVSKLLNTKVGSRVGYSVRFKTEVSKYTRVKYLTDGMLIRECVTSRGERSPFGGYSVVIIDEAHERSIRTDFLLGLLKLELLSGSRLKVVVMSATFQSSKFEDFFGSVGPQSGPRADSGLRVGCYSVPGRQFPVQLNYLSEPELDYLEAIMTTILTIHFTKPKEGDILVFLPGQEDIHHLFANLTEISRKMEALFEQQGEISFYLGRKRFANVQRTRLFPMCLYASMPPEQQSRVFDVLPDNYRKVILATNIAETSVTLPNIIYVVDSGMEKIKLFQSDTSIDALVMKEISKASSIQRAGRAGRVRPGEVYRMYTKQTYSGLLASQAPEILRTSLSETLLELIYVLDNFRHSELLGSPPKSPSKHDHTLIHDQQQASVKKILNFPFLSYPTKESILSTLKFLYRLEALDKLGAVTDLGIKLTMMPVPPLLGKLIYHSIEFGCTSEAITLVSMLSAECLLDYCSGDTQRAPHLQSADQQLSSSPEAPRKRPRFTHKSSSEGHQSYKNYLKSIMTEFGDHVGLIEAFNTWNSLAGKDKTPHASGHEQISFCSSVGISNTSLLRAKSIREQLVDITTKLFNLKTIQSCALLPSPGLNTASPTPENKWTPFYKCLTKSFWQNAAKLDPETNKLYLTEINRQLVNVHPTSSVSHLKEKPKWIIFTDIIQTKKTYIRTVSAINQLWLHDYCSKWFIAHEGEP
ncbi:putative ATP-dependent helicase [Cryptosporidium canis]|uniref:RNA helicase n=1 Tax=Cryptosporidium canis TaxID=195482 RepID=A0ABQ8P943_9CRYT|nr:putative ATP-dependent helicase [Cryptosporidium canis]